MNLHKHTKTKPKIKPLLKKVTAFLVAAVMSVTSLPLAAFAIEFVGNSNGNATYSYGSGFTYGFHGQYVSWRLSLYVSTSDDGTIDPATNSIRGQNGLGYIGSIFYDNFTPNISHDVYVQSNYTADMRNASIYNAAGNTVKSFPYVTKVIADDLVLGGSSSQDYSMSVATGMGAITPDDNYIFHKTSSPTGLPIYGSQCVGKTVENAVSSNDFTETVIEDINDCLGGKSDENNFYPLYAKVIQAGLGSEPNQKLLAAREKLGDKALDLLLPTNPDCIIEWCLVVEPVGEYTTWNNASFWEVNLFDPSWNYYEQGYIGLNAKTTMGLDAYAVAQYNEKTKSFYESENIIKYISGRVTGFEPKGYAGRNYTEYGKLRAEYYDTNTDNAASMNYDCHTECNPYCGVNVAGSDNFSYTYNPQYAASYGGISVYVTTREESIPVYYYIYDPNKPNAKPQKEVESYTFNDENTFYPSTKYGIPIADESAYEVRNDLDVLEQYIDFRNYSVQTGRYGENTFYPFGDECIDSKGNPNELNNPVSIETTPLKTKGGLQNKPAESIHVKVVKLPTIDAYYHIYNYFVPEEEVAQYKNLEGEEVLEKLAENGHNEPASIERVYEVVNNTAKTYTAKNSYGTLVHITDMLIGKELGVVKEPCPCCDGTITQKKNTNHFAADPSTVIDIVNNGNKNEHGDDNLGTRQIHIKVVNVKPIPPMGEAPPDRIKTYDVTQLIEDTKDVAENSDHLDSLTSYVDNENEYNESTMSAVHTSHVGNKSLAAVIESAPLSFDVNKNMDAKNNLSTGSYCSTSGSASDYYCPGHGHYEGTGDDKHWVSDSCPSGGKCSTTSKCTHSCSITQYICYKTYDEVKVAYGVSPTQIQYTKPNTSSSVTSYSAWKSPAILAGNSQFTTVGFTIPKDYYATPDVVKLHGSNKFSGDKKEFLLPKDAGMPNDAVKYAVFDVIYNRADDEYLLKYFDNSDEVKYQSKEMSSDDKKKDFESDTADTNFDYTNGNNVNINGVKFISHRDLLNGDNVTASLAVSGYMAKYATHSETADYLGFMHNAGFAFKGMNGITDNSSKSNSDKLSYTTDTSRIGHEQRTIWIANEATVSNLAATADGKANNAYNTNYTEASSPETHVRIGLGGKSADSVNMYSRFISSSSELKDDSLNKKTEKGDALRSIYYYATYPKGDAYSCNNYASAEKHNNWSAHSGTASSHGAHQNSATYTLHEPNKHEVHDITLVQGAKYVTTSGDQNLTKGIYQGHKVFTDTQTDMFADIYTSRLTFRIDLHVEGTIAGIWDDTNTKGLNYNSDKLEVKSGILRYQELNTEEEKTWREATFELVRSHYADLGEDNIKDNRNKSTPQVLAEYRYSIPTKTFKFNPSYYMQFDKGFDKPDQNQSVWMLSNQPREVNFKDILTVQLTQAYEKKYISHATDLTDNAKAGYSTTINSEWSTDYNDLKVQHATGLPTMKSGNAYTTSTEEQGGTITMYVVLQDPEFVASDRKSAVEAYNNAIMQSYQDTVNRILAEMKNMNDNVSAYTARTNANKSDYPMSLAMYTNMANGSSVNSAMQIHDNASFELAGKEPMVINTSGNEIFSYESAAGMLATVTNPYNIKYSDWTYYALEGNTFQAKLNGDKPSNFDDDFDISETATIKGTSNSNRRITINGMSNVVYSMASKDIPKHVSATLDYLNTRLTGIMSAPQYAVEGKNKDTGTTTIPTSYTPYLDSDATSIAHQFDWYGEDYEGFVVAVYSVEFDMYTKNAYKSFGGKYQADLTNGRTTTDPSTVYRHESDWKSNYNDMAIVEGDKHELQTPTYKLDGVTHMFVNLKNNNFELEDDGSIILLTDEGRDILENWSNGKYFDTASGKFKDMDEETAKICKQYYENGIYGIGMELANLPIKMQNTQALDGKSMHIGGDNAQVSFFYQPTYFNIRGSVYDTAR